ncbi:hypothetical protein B7463_g1038, partial [Scytalidium lignicola]
MNCDDTRTEAIKMALVKVQNVAYRAYDRLDTLHDLLNVAQVQLSNFDYLEWSTFNTFETFYGQMLVDTTRTNGGVITETLNYLDEIRDFLGNIVLAAQNVNADQYHDTLSLDIWCDSAWETTTDNNGRYYDGPTDVMVYWDGSGNNMGWIDPPEDATTPADLILCTNSPLDLGGYTINHDTEPVSVITICGDALDDMISNGMTLTSLGAGDIKDGTDLSDEVEKIPSFLLLHELSHAVSVMGRGSNTIDVKFQNPTEEGVLNAYGLENCILLAVNRPDLTIENADTLALLAAALYLQQKTWWTGEAEDLSYRASPSIQFLPPGAAAP